MDLLVVVPENCLEPVLSLLSLAVLGKEHVVDKSSLVLEDHLTHVGLNPREPLGRKVLLTCSV